VWFRGGEGDDLIELSVVGILQLLSPELISLADVLQQAVELVR